MLWRDQRWPTIQSADKDLPVILPLGSHEQHGHHLPLSVDTIQGHAIAEGAERATRNDVLLLAKSVRQFATW